MELSFIEAEKMGLKVEDLFLISFSKIDYYVTFLQKKYDSKGVNHLKDYLLCIVSKILDMWESLFLIYSNNKDYVSCCTLFRSIADNIAIIYLIYLNKNKEEMYFRHYLFILDGVCTRLKALSDYKQIRYNGAIKEEEFIMLKNQCNTIYKSDLEVKNYIEKILSSSPINKHTEPINKIIANKNWKYKNLISLTDNQMKWNELYNLYDDSRVPKIIEFMSSFVHGLSISNIEQVKDNGLFQPLFEISLFMLKKVFNAINIIFCVDIDQLDLDRKYHVANFSAIWDMTSDNYHKSLLDRVSNILNKN